MKTTTKREQLEERIRKHGESLLKIFPDAQERDPVKLCKKLCRLERQGGAVALRLCNGPAYAVGEDDKATDAILLKVNRLLGNVREYQPKTLVPMFVNRDPRGYALKIDDEYVRAHSLDIHTDWGGYGIIAPNLMVS